MRINPRDTALLMSIWSGSFSTFLIISFNQQHFHFITSKIMFNRHLKYEPKKLFVALYYNLLHNSEILFTHYTLITFL